jgi:hypothetical protein
MSVTETDGAAQQGSARDRAEHGMDQAERVAEDAVSRVTHWVTRSVERAREEVEDMWAEAREVSGHR